jgi:hypothetical protein
MFLDPVVTLVFLVGEDCRGGFFAKACGDGEATGSCAYDYYIVDESWLGLG